MSYRKYNQLGPVENKESKEEKLQQILSKEEKVSLLNRVPIVCVDVFADWCEPCRQIAPMYADLAKRQFVPGKCVFLKEDFTHGFSTEYKIEYIPAFLIFFRGALYLKIEGTLDQV